MSHLRSACVQLRGSDHVFLEDGQPGPKPISRPDAICLEQSLCLMTRHLCVGVLVHAGVAAKNEQIDAKSPAHLILLEKRGHKDKTILNVLTIKQVVARGGTEVGKRLSRSSKRRFS